MKISWGSIAHLETEVAGYEFMTDCCEKFLKDATFSPKKIHPGPPLRGAGGPLLVLNYPTLVSVSPIRLNKGFALSINI